ncbi:hypothetical protein ACJMK2_022378 [Sinanodonta woodiana]|uniref:Uncharacterized protein n=1 Tax=Sinanodonta woodiana TaxID=1069815 RepID=A0ABD3TJV1_SINWO
MQVIGFTKMEINLVFILVASILKIGNVTFVEKINPNGTDGCEIESPAELSEVAELIGCTLQNLSCALTQKTVEVHGEKLITDLTTAGAYYAQDALCKAIYSRLFSWLVRRINDSIRVKTDHKTKVMGVLDIYGFEVFQNNGFEQFIINYCNEKLQQIFIELTLKEEQEEYVKEGIQWINVDYFNNAVICDLIEKNNVGLLALLDEECLRPGNSTHLTLLEKFNAACKDHPHYESRKLRKNQSDRTLPHDSFRLKHYAGNVVYRVEEFIDKNNDLLFRDLSQAMFRCKHSLLKTLFIEGGPTQKSLKRPVTAGYQFKVSVAELMKNLLSKNPNYIRCIKPNDDKQAEVFDVRIVQHQFRYLGLLENVRVRRAGYAFRQVYSLFLYRYRMLTKETWPFWKGEPRAGVGVILKSHIADKAEYAFGKSKIFIRNPRTLFQLEEKRRDKMHDLATLIQKIWKGWKQRALYQQMRHSQIIIATQWRGYWGRKCYREKKKATLVLQTYCRRWKAMKELAYLKHEKRKVWAADVIRKHYVGWKVRKETKSRFRKIAGQNIARFLKIALKKQFLLKTLKSLPSMSPSDDRWPECSPLYKEASNNLRKLHHRWRCRKYRESKTEAEKYIMREKLTASELFKGKKKSYPYSVPQPFKGDYLNLCQNPAWKKIYERTHDNHVVFADLVQKINRANGKLVQHLLVVSTQAVLLIDHRTMMVKYRFPLSCLQQLSISPNLDHLLVFHLKKPDNGDTLTKKGDLIIANKHELEIVTKVYLAVQNQTGKTPQVQIWDQFTGQFGKKSIRIIFKPADEELSPGTIRVKRQKNLIEIQQS